MFPGMGPLCTGQGQGKKKKEQGGSAGGGKREAGVWELKKAKLGRKQMQMSNEQETYVDVDLCSCMKIF